MSVTSYNVGIDCPTEQKPKVGYRGKRAFDIIGASVFLILAAIPMLVIATIVWLGSPGPIIFRQKRMGQHGQEFWIWKFRTLYADAEQTTALIEEGDPRLVPLGWFLRKRHLDEFTQLLHVLRGTMSLVGPRPDMLVKALKRLEESEYHRLLLEHMPGLVGYICSQCKWEDYEKLHPGADASEDEWRYFRHENAWTNAKLLLVTVHHKVFRLG